MNVKVDLNKSDVLCHFKTEDVDVFSVDQKGLLMSKCVSLKDFTSAMSTSTKSVNVMNMEGFALGANIVKFRASEEGFVYYFLSRKGKYPLNNSGKLIHVHYPNVLFKIVVDSSKHFVSSAIFTIKDEDISEVSTFGIDSICINPEAKLYKYPFGNVSSEGVVCWGGNRYSNIETYQSIIEFVYSWYTTSSNGDYADPLYKDVNRSKAFKALKDKAFDEESLISTKHIFKYI